MVYGFVYLSRFDEAFLILMSSPGPGMGKSGPILVPLSALWTSASKLKVTPHLFFWTVVEASHEQKAAPGDFRLHTSWMSLGRACLQALKNGFLLSGKIRSHGPFVCLQLPCPIIRR